jgi:hypothetical protein
MRGIDRIAAERQRQIEQEGWTPEHDDEHTDGSLAAAAACYARPMAITVTAEGARIDEPDDCDLPVGWPEFWDSDWWKPEDTPIRRLEKAGALIAAEIDRLLRAGETE